MDILVINHLFGVDEERQGQEVDIRQCEVDSEGIKHRAITTHQINFPRLLTATPTIPADEVEGPSTGDVLPPFFESVST